MANTAYCGVPGSGKTYEVVVEVIVPALRSGRRVVTNVAGLHFEEMRAWLLVDGVDESAIGSLELVTKEQIGAGAGFWPVGGKESIVKPGDLVVLDECWRWMAAGVKIPDDMFAFLREHRHAVDASGVSCDVVLITQSITDLDRKVKVVIEKHFVMEKLKRIGLNKVYTVDVYNGYKGFRTNHLRRIIRKYKPEFFCFYSSYEGKGGDEREVDGRFNVLKRWWMWPVIVALPVVFLGCSYGLWRIYDRGAHPEKYLLNIAPPLVGRVNMDLSAGSSVGVVAGVAGPAVGGWRVVGHYAGAGRDVFVLQSGGAVRYVVSAQASRLNGVQMEVIVDGHAYSSYGGGIAPVGGVVGAR